MLASGCVFADTAKLEALVIDEKTEKPLANVEVTGWFEMNYGWLAVKGSPGPNICKALTDASGRCKLSGKTNLGSAGCYVRHAPFGYYDMSGGGGYDFKGKNIFGVWQPDDLVVTVRVQRVENPIPLFVKKVGVYTYSSGSDEDLFDKGDGVLRLDLMKGEWLPPVGNGIVADVVFTRLPRQDFGEGVSGSGIKGQSFRNSMMVSFPGDGNGLVEVVPPHSAALKIRTAPDSGYKPEYLCWSGCNKRLKDETSWDRNRCQCFRIRTRRNDKGEIVEAFYGKVYGDIRFFGMRRADRSYSYVASVNMLYYLNPNSRDRNLEWNRENLCKEPIYPRPNSSNLKWEYESFNMDLKL